VSLTYDDGLDSQLANALPDLDQFGFRATFFLTEENMRPRLSDWEAVARKGHEIADHTISHPCDLAGYSERDFYQREVRPMELFLDRNFGARPHDFAYPCGVTALGAGGSWSRSARYRRIVSRTFLAARTVDGAPNDPREVLKNRFSLHAFEPTYDVDAPDAAFDYVTRAVAQGAWAILVFHDVLPKRLGEGDTSIAVHRQILQHVRDSGVYCAPMGEIFAFVRRKTGALT
jgi:peptidoglycan/xylan/chitin deacetylase (PgdA/CDA1 family)